MGNPPDPLSIDEDEILGSGTGIIIRRTARSLAMPVTPSAPGSPRPTPAPRFGSLAGGEGKEVSVEGRFLSAALLADRLLKLIAAVPIGTQRGLLFDQRLDLFEEGKIFRRIQSKSLGTRAEQEFFLLARR